MKSADFIKAITDDNLRNRMSPAMVLGCVTLDARKREGYEPNMPTACVSLSGFVFQDLVTITGFKKEDFESTTGQSKLLISLSNSNFLGGLVIENSSGGWISISSCEARFINLWRCDFDTASLKGLAVDGSLDIHGLKVSESLQMKEVSYENLELSRHSDSAEIAVAETDDISAAIQFRMAGVKTIISTAMARKLSERPGEVMEAFSA
jgi:hypothetical protein